MWAARERRRHRWALVREALCDHLGEAICAVALIAAAVAVAGLGAP
jgi:hypothetical protein